MTFYVLKLVCSCYNLSGWPAGCVWVIFEENWLNCYLAAVLHTGSTYMNYSNSQALVCPCSCLVCTFNRMYQPCCLKTVCIERLHIWSAYDITFHTSVWQSNGMTGGMSLLYSLCVYMPGQLYSSPVRCLYIHHDRQHTESKPHTS